MKKTEMLEFLRLKLTHYISKYTSDAEKISEKLLADIEEAGMLPPNYEFVLGDKTLTDNAWEPEKNTCGFCKEPCGNDWCFTKNK